ncbi:thioredoxin [Cooperia oncophora]
MESSAWMQNIGNKQRGKFVMLLCDVDNPNVNYAMDFLSLKREGLPYVRLFVKSTNSVYKMEDSFDGEINEESVTAFMNAFEEGKLKSTVKSQELPDNWNATSLKTLVGNNFAEVVQNKTMNVLVLLHTAETSYTIPVFEKIAELYKDVINILIAKMDADHNGIAPPYKPAEMIPSVRLYEETTNIERIYEKDEITEEGITTFIEQTTGIVAKREEVQQVKPKPIISDLGSEPEKHVEL